MSKSYSPRNPHLQIQYALNVFHTALNATLHLEAARVGNQRLVALAALAGKASVLHEPLVQEFLERLARHHFDDPPGGVDARVAVLV